MRDLIELNMLKKEKKEKHKKIYKVTDQLIKMVLDPSCDVDTELLLFYIKSKIKKNDKERGL